MFADGSGNGIKPKGGLKFASGQWIIEQLEGFAPKTYALPDDKIGLQLGTLNKRVSRALVALDVTDAVVEEAITIGAELIIAHHAIIYRPLERLRTDTVDGKMYEKLIKHDIAVYISHTNLDVANGGINDLMAEALQLDSLTELETTHTEMLKKGRSVGLGRIGHLPRACSLGELAGRVKAAFDVPAVRLVGDLGRNVHKVAVLGGSGSRYIRPALFAGADVLITGDIDYHSAHDALAAGLAIIDPGHNAEKIFKHPIAAMLQRIMDSRQFSTSIVPSQIDTEVFQFL